MTDLLIKTVGVLPDNAHVYLPPAASAAILTPEFNATKHWKAERCSSPDEELSTACLVHDTPLHFVLSPPIALPSTPVARDPCERELTVIHKNSLNK